MYRYVDAVCVYDWMNTRMFKCQYARSIHLLQTIEERLLQTWFHEQAAGPQAALNNKLAHVTTSFLLKTLSSVV